MTILYEKNKKNILKWNAKNKDKLDACKLRCKLKYKEYYKVAKEFRRILINKDELILREITSDDI